MSEEISPLGENVLPVKELPIEEAKKPLVLKVGPAGVGNNRLVPILAGIIVLLLILLGGVLVYFQSLQKPPLPTPSPVVSVLVFPSPSATESGILKSVGERLGDLEKELGDTDLNNPTLVFPILDFGVNFDKKKQ